MEKINGDYPSHKKEKADNKKEMFAHDSEKYKITNSFQNHIVYIRKEDFNKKFNFAFDSISEKWICDLPKQEDEENILRIKSNYDKEEEKKKNEKAQSKYLDESPEDKRIRKKENKKTNTKKSLEFKEASKAKKENEIAQLANKDENESNYFNSQTNSEITDNSTPNSDNHSKQEAKSENLILIHKSKENRDNHEIKSQNSAAQKGFNSISKNLLLENESQFDFTKKSHELNKTKCRITNNLKLLNENSSFIKVISNDDSIVKKSTIYPQMFSKFGKNIWFFSNEFIIQNKVKKEAFCEDVMKENSEINNLSEEIKINENVENSIIRKNFIFVFYIAPKSQCDGVLRIWNENAGNAGEKLISLIEKYQWKEFTNSNLFNVKFNNGFSDYLRQFDNIGKGTNIVLESKNNSNIYYLIFQLERAINDFENILKNGKDTIAIFFLNFSDSLKETLNESNQWQTNLEVLFEKGCKIIMMNVTNEEFEGANIKEREVTVDMWREIRAQENEKTKNKESVPIKNNNESCNLENEVKSLREENKELRETNRILQDSFNKLQESFKKLQESFEKLQDYTMNLEERMRITNTKQN